MADGAGTNNRYFRWLNTGKMKIPRSWPRKGYPGLLNKMQQEVFEVLVLLTEDIGYIEAAVSRFILATIELLDRLIAF